MSEPLPPIVEWFRPDRRRQILRVFGIACTVLASGALLVGLANTGMIPLDDTWRKIVAIIGATTTISGPIIAVVGLPMAIGGDDYLALSTEGVILARKRERQVITWESLSAAHASEDGLRLALETGESIHVAERFADIELSDLAARINRTQQRAIMGLLPQPRARR